MVVLHFPPVGVTQGSSLSKSEGFHKRGWKHRGMLYRAMNLSEELLQNSNVIFVANACSLSLSSSSARHDRNYYRYSATTVMHLPLEGIDQVQVSTLQVSTLPLIFCTMNLSKKKQKKPLEVHSLSEVRGSLGNILIMGILCLQHCLSGGPNAGIP